MRPVVARDLGNEQLDVNQFYACLAATPKHVMANAYLPEKVAEQRALAEMLAGGADSLDRRPLISYTACWTVSPLRYATETVEILARIVAQRMPVVISSAPPAGATAPAGFVGTPLQIPPQQPPGLASTNLSPPSPPPITHYLPRHP